MAARQSEAIGPLVDPFAKHRHTPPPLHHLQWNVLPTASVGEMQSITGNRADPGRKVIDAIPVVRSRTQKMNTKIYFHTRLHSLYQ